MQMTVVIVLVVFLLVVGVVAFFAAKARADHRAEAQRYEEHPRWEIDELTERGPTRKS